MENVILLADKNSNAWGFAEKVKEYIKESKKEKIKLQSIPIGLFRNKEIEINPTDNLRKKDVYYIQDSTKDPQQWWVELLLIKDMALSASANSLTFVLPNMLYSRQDRKIKSRVPISARALANSIAPGIKKIITMDLHSGQLQGFYPATTPLDNLYSFPEVVRYLIKNYPEELKNFIILSPDAGGVTRARSFLRRIEESTGNKCELAFMIKERSRPGEVGEMRYVGPDPKGKTVFIVDDIVDSGGTLCSSAEVMRQKGASKLFCYATHGLFTEGTDKLCDIFDKILISNTHNFPKIKGVEVIDVSQLFAEAIYRAQKGSSISELFE
jgi:ribose-phosphate pyrophosphokinase